jgi:hypothetical protein
MPKFLKIRNDLKSKLAESEILSYEIIVRRFRSKVTQRKPTFAIWARNECDQLADRN